MAVIDLQTELMRVEEAADLLQIGRTKVYELMARHELPVVRIGRSVRIPRRGLQEWIVERTEGGGEIGG